MPNLSPPASLRLFGRTVTFDQGETAGLLTEIKGGLAKLGNVPTNTDRLPAIETAVTVTQPQQLVDLSTLVKDKSKDMLDVLQDRPSLSEFQAVLDKSNAGLIEQIKKLPVPGGAFVRVDDKSAPLIRLLIQAQAIALDETPDERLPKNDKNFPGWLKDDVAILALGRAAAAHHTVLDKAPDRLKERLSRAFDKFSKNSLPDRSERFAEMHALVADVAAFLNGA